MSHNPQYDSLTTRHFATFMAIPFFRKDRNKPDKEPTARQAGDGPPSQGLTTFGSALPDNHGILVEEVGGAPETALDEAAMFYASNQTDNAEQSLKTMLAGNEPRAWHMLFDLYRLSGRSAEFEQLALDYARKFETSPPNFGQPSGEADSPPDSTLTAGAALDETEGERLKNALSAFSGNQSVALDFTQLDALEAAGAARLAEGLTLAQKKRLVLHVGGATPLTKALREKLDGERDTEAWWQLLLSLYQLLGRQVAFEDLAVDYAVHFEMSPPSWENIQAAREISPAAAERNPDIFALKGVLSETSQNQIAGLLQYAQSRQEVAIDLSELTRLDYAFVGSFISHLMQLLGSGKVITLQGQNALVNELLRAMGIDQLAKLVPAKLT